MICRIPRFCLAALALVAAAGRASTCRAHDLFGAGDRAAHDHTDAGVAGGSSGRLRIVDKAAVPETIAIPPIVLRAIFGELTSGGTPRPAMADAFAPFKEQVKVRWDERWLYVESNGMPAHDMMIGITNWQQQVPLPKDYTGRNAWQIPLHPVPAREPIPIKNRFLRGAIALAVNGIPIFNPQNNRGELSQEIGELDKWGGHCGRGDDYHYHAAPLHLESIVGKGKPIAYALDGYPIYGLSGPDGKAIDEKSLDAYRGRSDAQGNYAYFASTKYPYVQGGFHGQVTEIQGQVDPQPSGHGIRPALGPLRGAKITGFTRGKDGKSYSLKYEVGGETRQIHYTINADGSVKFDFIDARGNVTSETHSGRGGDRPGPDRRGSPGGPPRDPPDEPRPPRR